MKAQITSLASVFVTYKIGITVADILKVNEIYFQGEETLVPQHLYWVFYVTLSVSSLCQIFSAGTNSYRKEFAVKGAK